MVLVGRELDNKKCINTTLLSIDIDEKFFKPSVVAHIKAIEICQKQNSKNPSTINEDKIIDYFNETLDGLCISVTIDSSKLVSSITIDEDEVKIITSEHSLCNIL